MSEIRKARMLRVGSAYIADNATVVTIIIALAAETPPRKAKTVSSSEPLPNVIPKA